ncbi:hypothetical protein KU6B_22760 [Mameliella alba]|nr:hypothetical protein KU6B_22760 [Mameliella alba]
MAMSVFLAVRGRFARPNSALAPSTPPHLEKPCHGSVAKAESGLAQPSPRRALAPSRSLCYSPAMLRIDSIAYSVEGRPLFEDASATIPEGHKVGLVGPNGAGKTTLFRLIRGN